MPFSYKFSPPLTPSQKLLLESKLAFRGAAGCLVLGVLGWIFDHFSGFETHLPALMVVGGLYLIMGLGHWQDALRAGANPSRKQEIGH
jgi:hypothetical protein